MSNKIRIEKLDGRILHRSKFRTQKLVDSGEVAWDQFGHTAHELKPSASSDIRRFAKNVLKIEECDLGSATGTCDLPYNYPLPYDLLRHYVG